MIISNISPFRAPVNLNSEKVSRIADSDPLRLTMNVTGLKQFFGDEFVSYIDDYDSGYTSISSDLIPPFFRNVISYRFEGKDDGFLGKAIGNFASSWHCKKVDLSIHLYDDTISLLKIDLHYPHGADDDFLAMDLEKFDAEVTAFSKYIYKEHILKRMNAVQNIKKLSVNNKMIMRYNKYLVFNDVNFGESNTGNEILLWTGRFIFVDDTDFSNEDLRDKLLNWARCALSDLQSDRTSRFFIGSGNSLVVCAQDCVDSWIKVLKICQFYYAILFVFKIILKKSYFGLQKENFRSVRRKERSRLLDVVDKRINHLRFIRLEFLDLKRGLQAERRKIIDYVCDSWKLEDLESGTFEREELISGRVSKIFMDLDKKNSRAIKLILSSIGVVSIVDIVLNFISTSENVFEDKYTGLLDLFKWSPPDVSIYVSVAIVALVFLFINRREGG